MVLTATGIVDNVMAGYLAEGVAHAEREGAEAVVIQLNTPGGSLDATQRIVSTLLDAPLPTIVWVTPSGARAASAGTFITLAGHLALMAPGTNIGAATPVGGGGEDIEGDLGQKVLNDAVASIRSIAETRGRNADWAEETVRDARSSPASEALEIGAIDGIAGSIDDVIAFADGRTVTVNGQPETLALAGATVDELAMNPFQQFLHLLSDPNISFILFTIGFYGLLFELQNPNFVTGILGALAIILAFIGFGSLPLNVAGLLLIVLAMILIGLELTVTSHGLLGLGGIVCFALGASALFTQPGDPFEPIVRVATPVVASTTVTAAVLLVLIVTFAVRTRAMPAPAGLVGSPSALLTRRHGRRPSVDRAARLGLPRRRGVVRPDRRWPAAGAWRSCARGQDRRIDRHRRTRPVIIVAILSIGGPGWNSPSWPRPRPSPSSSSSCWSSSTCRSGWSSNTRRWSSSDSGRRTSRWCASPACASWSRSSTGRSKSTSANSSSKCPARRRSPGTTHPINVDFLIYWRISDPLKSVVNVVNFPGALQGVATTTLRAVIGDILLDEVLSKREQINEVLRVKLDEVTERWGGKVTTVEIREITPPRDVQDAMNRQLSAERTQARGDHRVGGQPAGGDQQRRGPEAVGDPEGRG